MSRGRGRSGNAFAGGTANADRRERESKGTRPPDGDSDMPESKKRMTYDKFAGIPKDKRKRCKHKWKPLAVDPQDYVVSWCQRCGSLLFEQVGRETGPYLPRYMSHPKLAKKHLRDD